MPVSHALRPRLCCVFNTAIMRMIKLVTEFKWTACALRTNGNYKFCAEYHNIFPIDFCMISTWWFWYVKFNVRQYNLNDCLCEYNIRVKRPPTTFQTHYLISYQQYPVMSVTYLQRNSDFQAKGCL
jgi:hypothetical protein